MGGFEWPSKENGFGNVGLMDQMAAIDWTSKYIHLFKGDRSKITVMGESAGAGSIMHQLTLQGGTVPILYRSAIIQSPAFMPQYNETQLVEQYLNFSKAANCPGPKPLDCLRKTSSKTLQEANIN